LFLFDGAHSRILKDSILVDRRSVSFTIACGQTRTQVAITENLDRWEEIATELSKISKKITTLGMSVLPDSQINSARNIPSKPMK
jgi:hypothetical protein